jgi:hypothetical protein
VLNVRRIVSVVKRKAPPGAVDQLGAEVGAVDQLGAEVGAVDQLGADRPPWRTSGSYRGRVTSDGRSVR